MPDSRYTHIAIWCLAVVAVMTALRVGAALFAPVVFAMVIGVVLSPVARRIDKFGAPRALSAFVTLLLMLTLLAGLLILVEPVLSSVVSRAPIIWFELRETISSIQSAVRGIDQMSEQVADALSDDTAPNRGSEETAVAVPTAWDALMLAPSFAAWFLIFIGTLYFFLLSRRDVYDWISASVVGIDTETMLTAEREVSRYFLTVGLINAGFGTLMAVVLWWLGLPYAILWGFVLFLANFVLYLGPAIYAVALLIAGTVAFDDAMSFLPAAIFIAMNLVEAQFVTPGLVGRHMQVNPLLIFLSLVFWLWLWGPIGGIIAIPILVWALALKGHYTAEAARETPTPILEPQGQ